MNVIYTGKGADVFLASAELAAIVAIEGKLPSVAEYMKYSARIEATAADTFRCEMHSCHPLFEFMIVILL